MSRSDAVVAPLLREWQRLRLRFAQTPIPAWFAWWVQALASWLPPHWRRLLSRRRAPLWLILDSDGLTLRLGDDSTAPVQIGHDLIEGLEPRLDPDAAQRPRRLALPLSRALRCQLDLPAAAAERLRDVAGFEIDRQTPFTADQVVYDARVVAHSPDRGTLRAELVVLPKAQLDAALAALGPLATTLEAVDLTGPNGPLGLNLLPPERRHRRSDPERRTHLLLIAIALTALWFALWQSLDNRRQAVAELEARIAVLRDEARLVSAQRQRLMDAVEGSGFLAEQRALRPPVIALLEDISRRLPDVTALERLNLNGTDLIVIGYSSEAPATVSRLQGSPYLKSPALSGAVQPDRISGRDRFTLNAQVVVPTEGAANATP